MLLKIGKPADDPAAPLFILEVKRSIPKRKPEAREQPQHAKLLTFPEQSGQNRIARIKRDADRDRLPVAQRVARQSLKLVGRPVTIIERPGRSGLERITAVRD